MFPDLRSMSQGTVVRVSNSDLQSGIEYHHHTDLVFHHAPTFVELCVEARRSLRAAGVPRASSLALAHVGIELLLDGELGHLSDAQCSYKAALQVGATREGLIVWRHDGDAFRFSRLCSNLSAGAIPHVYRSPRQVAERLIRIINARPRLACGPQHEPAIVDWVEEARSIVSARWERLMAEVESALGL
jgi:hypothetical protein